MVVLIERNDEHDEWTNRFDAHLFNKIQVHKKKKQRKTKIILQFIMYITMLA